MSFLHDAPIAMFKFSDKDDHTAIHITLDAKDLSGAVLMQETDFDIEYLQNYINQHFDIILDGLPAAMNLKSMSKKFDHIHVVGSLDISISKVKQINVRNTCLLGVNDQSNIVQLQYGDRLRDFRMSEQRQEIQIDL